MLELVCSSTSFVLASCTDSLWFRRLEALKSLYQALDRSSDGRRVVPCHGRPGTTVGRRMVAVGQRQSPVVVHWHTLTENPRASFHSLPLTLSLSTALSRSRREEPGFCFFSRFYAIFEKIISSVLDVHFW